MVCSPFWGRPLDATHVLMLLVKQASVSQIQLSIFLILKGQGFLLLMTCHTSMIVKTSVGLQCPEWSIAGIYRWLLHTPPPLACAPPEPVLCPVHSYATRHTLELRLCAAEVLGNERKF